MDSIMWDWRVRLQQVKRAVVREVVPQPDLVPSEFDGVVTAFPFSYASGRTIIDICRERGIGASGRILIVGAYGGRDYHWLRSHGHQPAILDLERHVWADGESYVGDAASEDVWRLTGGDFDLIVMCDVLEHIPNDFAVLKHARSALREGGALFISVPFHHDVEVTHLRAYTLATLTRLLASAGLDVARVWLRPGLLEVAPRLLAALHYGVGLATPTAVAGKVLAGLLEMEYRLNDMTRPAARALIGHQQQGAHILCVSSEVHDHLAANQSAFCT